MTREELWEEFENQLIRETRTSMTMNFDEAEIMTKLGIKETVAKWKDRLEQEPCEDAVSRQAAIDRINKQREHLQPDIYPQDKIGDAAYRICAEFIERLPSAQPEQQWIPCSERLPEEPYGCLVTVWDTNPVTMDEFENILPYFVGWDGEQWNDGDGEQCPFEVVAWMPLPEPYREETEREE